jgi:hypothetical protein
MELAKRKSAVTCRFAALGQIADMPVIENGDGNGKDTRESHQDGLYHEDGGYFPVPAPVLRQILSYYRNSRLS